MQDDHEQLRNSLWLVTMQLNIRVLATDWSDPDDVQHSDRLMKLLSAYGRNIEKCIAMTPQHGASDTQDHEEQEAERLRASLHRELVRYANRLGPEELARRLELDRAEAGSERVEILGKERSMEP